MKILIEMGNNDSIFLCECTIKTTVTIHISSTINRKMEVIKIILYADDLVIFSSCCTGLQQKTDVDLVSYNFTDDLMCNCKLSCLC